MITFTHGAHSVVINNPEWSYIPSVHMAFEIIELHTGYSLWNNGIALDYRTCSIDRTILSAAEAIALDAFILAHRGDTIDMDIGTASNFFPFMPDKGDTGTFTVKILDRKFGQFDQFNQFSKSFDLLMVSAPAYSLPSVFHQGNFQIGSVNGLMFPQLGIDPAVGYGITHGVTYGGDYGMVDVGRNVFTTTFTQRCNKGLAAQLLAYLTGATGRFQDVQIVAPSGYYAFGPSNGSSGTYTGKMIQNTIECRHLDFEEFEIPLSFWMREAA